LDQLYLIYLNNIFINDKDSGNEYGDTKEGTVLNQQQTKKGYSVILALIVLLPTRSIICGTKVSDFYKQKKEILGRWKAFICLT